MAFWLTKYLFRTDWDNHCVLIKDFTLRSIYPSNQPLWKNHGIARIHFDSCTINESKSSKNIPRNHAVPGLLFFLIALGTSRPGVSEATIHYMLDHHTPYP